MKYMTSAALLGSIILPTNASAEEIPLDVTVCLVGERYLLHDSNPNAYIFETSGPVVSHETDHDIHNLFHGAHLNCVGWLIPNDRQFNKTLCSLEDKEGDTLTYLAARSGSQAVAGTGKWVGSQIHLESMTETVSYTDEDDGDHAHCLRITGHVVLQ